MIIEKWLGGSVRSLFTFWLEVTEDIWQDLSCGWELIYFKIKGLLEHKCNVCTALEMERLQHWKFCCWGHSDQGLKHTCIVCLWWWWWQCCSFLPMQRQVRIKIFDVCQWLTYKLYTPVQFFSVFLFIYCFDQEETEMNIWHNSHWQPPNDSNIT